MNNHLYKIGQRIALKQNGQEFYVIGIKTSSSEMCGLTKARLVIHENKNEPTRNGYVVWPCQCELLENKS